MLGGRLADHPTELGGDRVLRLLVASGVLGRQGELEAVRRPHLRDADAPPRLHLAHDQLRDLDGLHAAAEGLGEQTFDESTEASFEVAEDRHDVR